LATVWRDGVGSGYSAPLERAWWLGSGWYQFGDKFWRCGHKMDGILNVRQKDIKVASW
jgi:hypothetical protein